MHGSVHGWCMFVVVCWGCLNDLLYYLAVGVGERKRIGKFGTDHWGCPGLLLVVM